MTLDELIESLRHMRDIQDIPGNTEVVFRKLDGDGNVTCGASRCITDKVIRGPGLFGDTSDWDHVNIWT